MSLLVLEVPPMRCADCGDYVCSESFPASPNRRIRVWCANGSCKHYGQLYWLYPTEVQLDDKAEPEAP